MHLEINRSFAWLVLLVEAVAWRTLGLRLGFWAGLLVVASVMAHEMGHFVVAKAFGVPVKRVGLNFKGGYILRECASSRKAETLITLAGPSVNLLLFAAFAYAPPKFSWWVAFMNLLLALVNLVPIGKTDGARLFRPRCTVVTTPNPAPGVTSLRA